MYKIIDGNKECADVAYLFSEIASPLSGAGPLRELPHPEDVVAIFDS